LMVRYMPRPNMPTRHTRDGRAQVLAPLPPVVLYGKASGSEPRWQWGLGCVLLPSLAGLVGGRLKAASAQRKVSYAGGCTLIGAGALTLAIRRS
jgi:hypothetical protein